MKRTLQMHLVLGCCLGTAQAAVITSANVVTSTQLSGNAYSATTSTFAYTVPSGADRCLVVVINTFQQSNFDTATVGSVTYGGVPMTRAVSRLQQESWQENLSEIWYLADPVAGVSQNVVMSGWYMEGVANAAVTLSGVDPLDPIGQTGSTGSNAESATLSLTLNNLELGSWVVSDLGNSYGTGTNSPNTNITGTFFSRTGTSQNGAAGYTVVDGTSETFSWSYSNNTIGRASLVAAEFRAIPEPSVPALVLPTLAGLVAFRRPRRQAGQRAVP